VSLVNLQAREISIKVVYYGPGLGGKTSTLQYIHRALKPESRGQLVSLATGADRTLYFDFLPVRLPKLRGYSVRVQLYTVPGQVHYNSTRKLVLNGCDGVVFVADSQRDREAANVESLVNLNENLREQGLAVDKLPFVLQWNKRDCADVLPADRLDKALNPHRRPAFETIAMTGKGVFDTLKSITTEVLQDLRRKGVWDPRPETTTATGLGPAPSGKSNPQLPVVREGSAPSVLAAGMLSEKIIEFAERDEASAPSQSGLSPLPAEPVPPGSLSELIPPGPARNEVRRVETCIASGDYAGAIRRAGKQLRELAAAAGPEPDGGTALVALLYRVSPERYLRMRELLRRVDAGAVSQQDAVFALFFLVDLELNRFPAVR
jgi:signal recognition particle receptor subunit beta